MEEQLDQVRAGAGERIVDTPVTARLVEDDVARIDRKSTRLNSSHQIISYAVFCLKKKKKTIKTNQISQHKKNSRAYNAGHRPSPVQKTTDHPGHLAYTSAPATYTRKRVSQVTRS